MSEAIPTNQSESFSQEKRKLSEATIEGLIASIGNHENKAITLLLMKSNVVYSIKGLQDLFNRAQSKTSGWKVSIRIPGSYCEASLSPIGMVKEILNQNLESYGFMKTMKGETLGDAFAGYMLDFSDRHPDLSLSQLFGYTTSPASHFETTDTEEGPMEQRARAPIIRFKLFKLLMSGGIKYPLNQKEIANRLGIEHGLLSKHLQELGRLGIINYESAKMDEEHTFYKLVPNANLEGISKYFNSQDSNLRKVYPFLTANQDSFLSRGRVADMMIADHPDLASQREKLVGRINTSFHLLERAGVIKRLKFSREQRSEVVITEEQRSVIDELATLFNTFQNQDPRFLENGRVKGRTIVEDPEKVSNLTEKARSVSANANKSSPKETADQIYQMLRTYPNISNRNIKILLLQEYNKDLTSSSVNRMLRLLINQRRAIVSTRTNANYYSAVKQPNDANPVYSK